MVRYHAPDDLDVESIGAKQLPSDWARQEDWTQRRGDDWHRSLSTPPLRVPSVIVPLDSAPDVNVVINHGHPAAEEITVVAAEPFVLDPRLL